jgi:hypothetical protein
MRSLTDQPPPCVGNAVLYDTALFGDATPTDRQQAIHRAAALCATCPAQCDAMVTTATAPRELVLLDLDWMPPAQEGRPDPTPAPRPVGRRRNPVPPVGREYVKPDRRVSVWATMAARQAAFGMPLAAIAESLCVTEDTAVRLLEIGRGLGRAS